MIKKENDTNIKANRDKTKNMKFEQEEEIIVVLKEKLKQEECIKIKPRISNQSHDEKRYTNDNDGHMRPLNFNGYSGYLHEEFKNVKNQHNNSDDTRNTQNCQKKLKLTLKIDSIESLNPQYGQCASNSDQRELLEGYSPKDVHHAAKRMKDKEKDQITSPRRTNQQIHQNGKNLFPKKKLEDIPKITPKTYKQNTSRSFHKGTTSPQICNPNPPNFKSSSSKNTPLPPKPSISTLWQRQGSINYKILRGLDLVCWETLDVRKLRTNEKYDVAYKNMIKKYPLIALFKCMGRKCSYATDDPVRMLNHLTVHDNDMKRRCEHINKKYNIEMKSAFDKHERNKLKNKESEDLNAIHDYFLCCSYCQIIEKDSKSLVHHINDIHRKDIYQCGFCFFRSCAKETCLAHWEKSHTNKLILIYECPGKEKHQVAKNKVMGRLVEKRKINVVPLMCKVCEVGFYPLKEFLEHCEKDHREPHERKIIEKHLHILDEAFRVHAYGMFQCLYCMHGCHKESQMSAHLVQHPSEFGFYCVRRPHSYRDAPHCYHSVDSTTIFEVQKEVKLVAFNENLELLSSKNYKEIIDSDLRKMLMYNY